jgi:hypothetical protein
VLEDLDSEPDTLVVGVVLVHAAVVVVAVVSNPSVLGFLSIVDARVLFKARQIM